MNARNIFLSFCIMIMPGVCFSLENSTPVDAFASYVEAIESCDDEKIEEIIHDLPDNFQNTACEIDILRKITFIMEIDETTIEFLCANCNHPPMIEDVNIYSIYKMDGFDWMKCGHLFRKFDEGWKLISWSCGDYQ